MNKIELPVNLVQTILNYLQARPYAEVAAMIAEIVKAAPVQPSKPVDAGDGSDND